MKVLSLFDGMACGMIAFKDLGMVVDKYYAYEIDKYAIQTSSHNFPMIEHCGDVFDADFTKYTDIDWLIGGSPCTYWSIAQKNNRETEASGIGWELFSQYVRALHEAKPKYFLYENNKSMSKAIKESISQTFGFEPIMINAALVSAQNRQRLYWVGIRNDDGTYRKADIEQPADRGILLKDIIEDGIVKRKKAHCLKHQAGNARDYFKKHHTNIKFEPVNITDDGKSQTIKSQQYYKNAISNFCCYSSTYGASGIAEPVIVAQRGRNPDDPSSRVAGEYLEQRYEAKNNGKSNVLTRVSKDNLVAEPIRIPPYGNKEKSRPVRACYAYKGSGEGSLSTECFPNNPNKQVSDYVAEPINTTSNNGKKSRTLMSGYYKYGTATMITNEGFKGGTTGVAEPIRVGALPRPNGELSTSQGMRIYSTDGKSVTQSAQGGGMGAKTGLYGIEVPQYAEVTELIDGVPTKAKSFADGKEYTVYKVENGQITIKGKQYPIKLIDGYYIIRKLTVKECMRLQTVPEWYEFPVSNTQAYKMLGNGWCVEVIKWLIESALNEVKTND